MQLLLFVLILGVLVFVHEFGHFWTARRLGIGVHEFGFGFPPKLWGIKRNGVEYTINLIPFGGFVRLVGETAEEANQPNSLPKAGLKKKLAILSAGVLMNALLAWLLLIVTLSVGTTEQADQLPSDRWANVTNQRTEVYVVDGSAAASAGLLNGDRLVRVNDQEFANTDTLIAYLQNENYPTLKAEVIRYGTIQTISIDPDRTADTPSYGFGVQRLATVSYPWYVAPYYGLTTAGNLMQQTVSGFGQLAKDLFTQGRVSEDITGPVGIAVLTGQIQQLGIIPLLQFIAILSISLAVINFLPLPALDGGRAALAVVEHARKRPLNPRVEQLMHSTGFYLLILLLLVISIRDVRRFDLVDKFLNLFR